eukprot:m.308734 g.308734  ORF g.308734 m.308734 type:complete len:308 (+) comp44636_c0_seq1:55-978(+)
MTSRNGDQMQRALSSSTTQEEEELTRKVRLRRWWRGFKRRVQLIVHNKETGEYLTRTPSSWAKIGAFYFVFYSCLAAIFAICMTVFLVTVPSKEDGPRFTDIIESQVGFGIAPKRDSKKFAVSYDFNGDLDKQERDMDDSVEKAFLAAGYTATGLHTLFSAPNGSDPDFRVCNGKASGTRSDPCVFVIVNRISDFRPDGSVSLECKYVDGTLLEFEGAEDPLDLNPSSDSPVAVYPQSIQPEQFAFNKTGMFENPFFVLLFDLKKSYNAVEDQKNDNLNGEFECTLILKNDENLDSLEDSFKIEYFR